MFGFNEFAPNKQNKLQATQILGIRPIWYVCVLCRAALTGKISAGKWPPTASRQKISCYKIFILHNKRFDMTSWFGFPKYIFCSERDIHLFIFFAYLDWHGEVRRAHQMLNAALILWLAVSTRVLCKECSLFPF